jgi:hypothetical protein
MPMIFKRSSLAAGVPLGGAGCLVSVLVNDFALVCRTPVSAGSGGLGSLGRMGGASTRVGEFIFCCKMCHRSRGGGGVFGRAGDAVPADDDTGRIGSGSGGSAAVGVGGSESAWGLVALLRIPANE